MRNHIAKSLQTRCKTIHRAVNEFNTAAAALESPRPPLDWSQVANYAFVEQFTLLQDTRNDLHSKTWSQPFGREVLKSHRRIARAKEEVDICNLEACRLLTSIRDEDSHFISTLARLSESNDPIYGAVEEFATRHRHINKGIKRRINQIPNLPGFSGALQPGIRLGFSPPSNESSGGHSESTASDVMEGIQTDETPLPGVIDHEEMEEVEEDLDRDVSGLAQFFEGLSA